MEIKKIICDCCGEEIPIAKKKDMFGIEREYYRRGKLNFGYPFTNVNILKDICEKCAGDISVEMLQWKMDVLSVNQ